MSEQSGPFSGGGSVRRALSLGICYVLGTFNDNFFKQGALLLALAAGNTSFPAWATVLFSLPFALFSVWAGWLADRFPKKNLVMGAKTLELAAIVHDIACPLCREKYGNTNGNYQQLEGASLTREFFAGTDVPAEQLERIV